MSANFLFKDENADQPVNEERGILPRGAGVRSSIVTPVSDQPPKAESDDTDTHRRECRYCTETLPPGAIECPLCLRAVADARKATQMSSVSGSRHLAAVPSAGSSMAGAGTPQAATVVHSSAESPDSGAVYTLESQVKCPGCEAEISTLHVIRGLRTQVSFTSTLPRKAYVIACPACGQLLSAGLSGVF